MIAGKRVWPNANGFLDAKEIDQAASYGRATNPRVANRPTGWWQVTTPDGLTGSLNPSIHQITEHEDGTITVSPSLDMSDRVPGGWHGWLENGVFRSC